MFKDSIIALSTPVGESAIGVLRLSGGNVIPLIEPVFHSKNLLSKQKSGTLQLGKMVRPDTGEMIDEVLIAVFRNPHSYTGEDVLEISCHGSPLILKEMLEFLQSLGMRIAEPGEFTQRAYLNGKMDLTRAEAVNDLIRAHTRYSKLAALSQLEGNLASKTSDIHNDILSLLAQLEAAIDHSDLEEIFIQPEVIESSIHLIRNKIAALLNTAKSGQLAREGVRAAIVGAPNAGKSSLMNLLLQADRVIVSDIPGTTRDTVESELSVKGLSVRLIDTAGIRPSSDRLEELGIERSRKAIEEADLRLMVFDASRTVSSEDREIVQLIQNKPNLYILNKTDLPQVTTPALLKEMFGFETLSLSVNSGEGLDTLEEAIHEYYFSFGCDPARDVLVTNARQEGLLRGADSALEIALQTLRDHLSEEFIASGVRKARAAVEEIAGKTGDDAILDRIFSQFCIGK